MPDDRKFLDRCREQFKLDCEQERRIREEARIDLEYVSGEGQWDADIKRRRQEDGRPALTFNKLHTYLQSVANEARQNKPQPKVAPMGSGATTDLAAIHNGILRHIQYRSQADVASDTALDYSAGGGFGYLRWKTEWADDRSRDQEICIEPILDPFSVYGVLYAACRGEEPDHSFIVKRPSRDKYRELYGGGEPVDFNSDEWKDADDWLDDKSVRVAEYWWRKKIPLRMRLVVGQDGSTAPIYSDDTKWDQPLPWLPDDDDPGQPFERDAERYEVNSCVIDGARVLPNTRTKWINETIPIIPVLGRMMVVNGEIKLFGLIRHVREPQQLINIYKSGIAEAIALGNRVPYIGAEGQMVDPRWDNANRVNYSKLEYKPVTVNGVLLPPPTRQTFEAAIQALSEAAAQEVDDLKSGMGIWDATLGAQANEQSGVAIARRNNQSNIINYHFVDNLQRALFTLCRQLLKAIPKIYDRPGRQVRIVGEDQEHSVIIVNREYTDPETGKQKHYPLDVGDYDVVITVGPSWQTARQETMDTLGDLLKNAPQLVPIIGDLFVGSFDTPWAREAARRLKLAAPQQIVNEPQDQGGQQIPPQVQQAVAQMQQKLQTTEAFAQSLHQQLETKAPEIQSRERIEAMKVAVERERITLDAQTKLAVAGYTAEIAQLREEIGAIKHESALRNQRNMQAQQHSHDAGMQATQQAHEADQTASDQEFQGDQADSDRELQEMTAKNAAKA